MSIIFEQKNWFHDRLIQRRELGKPLKCTRGLLNKTNVFTFMRRAVPSIDGV